MAIEFGEAWKKKIRHYAKVLDFDGDGVITENDFVQLADRYAQVGQLAGPKAKQVRRKLVNLWNDFFGMESMQGEKITVANFPEILKKRGKEKIRHDFTLIQALFFDVVDLNGDGVIQKREFEILYEIYKIDKAVVDESFKALDTNGDGLLSYEEFVDAGVDYFTQEECTYPQNMILGPMKD